MQDNLHHTLLNLQFGGKEKVNKRGVSTMLVAGIIIVVLVIAAVGVYIYTRPTVPTTAFEYVTLNASPASFTWGDEVNVTVTVRNTETTEVTENVTITLNDAVTLKKAETLAANETKTVTFLFSNGTYTAPGLYTVKVPGTSLQNSFTVKAIAHVGLVMATGGLGDKSFNDISYAGVVRASQELGIDFDFVEPKAIAEYEGFQTDFAKTGKYEIIVCVGFDQNDSLTKVAGLYPDQKFALVDMPCPRSNVASLLFRANEGSYLVGVVAGMKTKTGKVGFVGGMDIPLIRDFFEGFEAGAKWANSTVTVVAPVFVGGWADPSKGKELGEGLVDLGVDAIFVAAGKSGLGALLAAHENGILGLGVDACQCYLYPEIEASMTKRVDVAIFETIKAAVEGEFQGGIKSGGLKEHWVGACRLPEEEAFWESRFGFTHTALETTVTDKMKEARDKIVAGEITVPSGYD
jgi:basic membrane protein A